MGRIRTHVDGGGGVRLPSAPEGEGHPRKTAPLGPGRARISVPCSDQKLLRSTLKQLNALGEEKPKHQQLGRIRGTVEE